MGVYVVVGAGPVGRETARLAAEDGENAATPVSPALPLDPTTRKGAVRTITWQRAAAATVPAIEVRASDFLGQGAVTCILARRSGRRSPYGGWPTGTNRALGWAWSWNSVTVTGRASWSVSLATTAPEL